MLNNNKRGQIMMVGILILVMTILVFVSVLPAVSNVMDSSRQCDALNCEGYTDPDATGASGGNCTSTNRSYNPDLNENELSCTIMDLFLPLVILAVVIGLVTKLLHGGLVDKEPEYGYSQGY